MSDNTSFPAGKATNSITLKEYAIPIANIVRDPSLMMREKLDDATVSKYATAMARGAKFPPVEIMQVGSRFLLTHGFHRTAAADQNGDTAIWASVRCGDMEGAILAAARADAHGGGLKRSNKDKRRAVEALLATEWAKDKSDQIVADAAGVHQTFVSKLRRPTQDGIELPSKRIGKDGRIRSTKPPRYGHPEHDDHGAGNDDLDHGDHGAGDDGHGQDDLLKIWDECDDDDFPEKEQLRNLLLTEFFATATGADLLLRIPVDNRTAVISELLDRLGAEGLRQMMSPELKRELLPPSRTAPEIELGEDGYPNPPAGLQRLH